ncbi:MAG: hypothetical protein E7161_00945 [Firmicutes bacterium]|nr:hypothetical protein [Bacillota bacterium]
MTKKIVAISGGENGRILENGQVALYETEPMDREIINLTNKKAPNFLFLAHAMSFSLEIQESYYQTMKKIYGDKFGCSCKNIKTNELEDNEKVKELIEWADIIYEGGGDTVGMVELWKKTNFDKLLFEAWKKGKVICGVSAGAVCWFNSCNSDSDDDNFDTVDCLNWINAFFTPHCDEKGRYESSKIQLKDKNIIGLIMSNCSAIEIIDDKYRIITSDANDHGFNRGYGYKAYWHNNKYYEINLVTDKFLPLNDLLEKNLH